MIEDETTKKAFEEDSHLYLMHPKMYVVPDYTRREQEKDAQQKTAITEQHKNLSLFCA